MDLTTLYLFSFSVVITFNLGVCDIICYQFHALCGPNSYKQVSHVNKTDRRSGITCYSMCKSTDNCDGVNFCWTNQGPYCEIIFEDENEKFPCQNVSVTNNGCTYYKLVPKLDIPDYPKSRYIKIVQTDHSGNVVNGSKGDLKAKIFDGADVVAVIKNWGNNAELLVNVDVVLSSTKEVCLQSNWNTVSFESSLVLRTILTVCTNGDTHRQDWVFGMKQKIVDIKIASSVDWFVRQVMTTNNLYNVNTPGYPEDIISAVKSGKEITIASAPHVLFTKNAIIQNNTLFSYNLWELSYDCINGIYTFKLFPYWYSSVITSNNKKLVGRWKLESSQKLTFNSYAITSVNYIVDNQLQIIAKTDENGKRMKGSLNKLKHFVRNGHRLRVYVNNRALEAIHIAITSNVVTVMNFGSLKLAGNNLDTSMILIMGKVSTNDLAQFYEVPIGSDNVSSTEANTFEIEWFVDVRQWNLIYSTQKFVEDENSFANVFQNVIDSGSKLRLSWLKEDKEEIFTIDTLIKKGSEYQAFTAKNIKITSSKVYYNFFRISPNGMVKIGTVGFGSGIIHTPEYFHNQNLKWFTVI